MAVDLFHVELELLAPILQLVVDVDDVMLLETSVNHKIQKAFEEKIQHSFEASDHDVFPKVA